MSAEYYGDCSMTTLLWVVGIVVLLIIWANWYAREKEKCKLRRRFVIMCEVNGRYGVVLLDDFIRATEKFWQPYLHGAAYDFSHVAKFQGQVIDVEPVYVLSRNELVELSYCTYIQRGVFKVPHYVEVNSGYKDIEAKISSLPEDVLKGWRLTVTRYIFGASIITGIVFRNHAWTGPLLFVCAVMLMCWFTTFHPRFHNSHKK